MWMTSVSNIVTEIVLLVLYAVKAEAGIIETEAAPKRGVVPWPTSGSRRVYDCKMAGIHLGTNH